MKILFAGVFSYESTNTSQLDGLQKNGNDVIPFNYREEAKIFGNENRDKLLVDIVRSERVDLVIFSKCNEINYWVVDECNKYCKTILWYMDTVNSNFSQPLIEKIKRCTVTVCAIWASYLEAKKYGKSVEFLHEGYDHLSNYPIDNLVKKYDVSFIGQLRNKRFEYHDAVKFNIIQDAYGKEHSKAVGESKINLNFTEGGTSDRTYKVLASKGFLLTEPWTNMEMDFIIGRDLDVFTNILELNEKIRFYLSNEELRNKIAENGWKTVQKFDRINWAKSIVNFV